MPHIVRMARPTATASSGTHEWIAALEPGDIIFGVDGAAVLICIVERTSDRDVSGRRMLTGGTFSLDRISGLLSWMLGDIEWKDLPVIHPALPQDIAVTLRSLDKRLIAGGSACLTEAERVALMFCVDGQASALKG